VLTNKSREINWLLRYFPKGSFKKMASDARLTVTATPHNLGLLLTPASLRIPCKPSMQSKVCALPAEAERNALE
jgi:hypothetical protein